MPSLKRTFFPRSYHFAAQILAFFISFTCEYSTFHIFFDTMAPQTRSQSVVAARFPLLKPGRPPITKGRMCQRYVRNYQTNPRGVYLCSRGLGKMKCGLYITVKHACIIVSRSLFT
jgi:hypothetical protein